MNPGSFFSNDSAFGRLMTKCGTIIAINILFAITCIPFFTIGAGGTAMYHCVFEMLSSDTPINPFKEYWRGLRKNFIRATICWLIFAVVMVLGVINLRICAQWGGTAQYLSAGVISVMIVAIVTIVYLFPVLATFPGKVPELAKLSICTAMAHPLNMLIIIFLSIAPVALFLIDEVNRPTYAFFGTFFAFSLIAYLIGKKLLPQFKLYLRASEAG